MGRFLPSHQRARGRRAPLAEAHVFHVPSRPRVPTTSGSVSFEDRRGGAGCWHDSRCHCPVTQGKPGTGDSRCLGTGARSGRTRPSTSACRSGFDRAFRRGLSRPHAAALAGHQRPVRSHRRQQHPYLCEAERPADDHDLYELVCDCLTYHGSISAEHGIGVLKRLSRPPGRRSHRRHAAAGTHVDPRASRILESTTLASRSRAGVISSPQIASRSAQDQQKGLTRQYRLIRDSPLQMDRLKGRS